MTSSEARDSEVAAGDRSAADGAASADDREDMAKPELLADYEATLDLWKWHADARFKLLGLVPTVTAAGVGVFGTRPDFASAIVAAGAMLAIVGIVMYDLRNTVFYDSLIHRAKDLERRLHLPQTNALGGGPGLFGERPRGRLRLFGITVWHDRALSVIYSASFGGWATVLVRAATELAGWPAGDTRRWLVAVLGGAGAFAALAHGIHDYGRQWDRRRSNMEMPGAAR